MSLLLNNLNDIYKRLIENKSEFSIKISIGDFNSTDIDFQKIIPTLDVPCNIINIQGTFNIAIALQTAADSVVDPDDIIFLCDCDSVFDDGVNLLTNIYNKVEQGKSFYCIIPANELQPHLWRSKFNGKVHVPLEENGDSGTIGIYNSDFKKSGGFTGSEFMGSRGQSWGGHDGFISKKLNSTFKIIRHVEPRIWLRGHPRSKKTKWFSHNGHSHYKSVMYN